MLREGCAKLPSAILKRRAIVMSIRRLKARGIGRLELLAWLNELLETDYTKLEHLADGIAYCQLLDALHPGKVPLHQVDFHAKSHAEYERNFRVLRRACQACEIRVEIPVRKLVDGVFQEHFEFLHWLHDYAHKTYPDAVRKYNGFARRQQVLLGSGGNATLSVRELNHTNMNLVPSYAALSKGASDGVLTSGRFRLALDIIDSEDVPDNLTLDDLVADDVLPVQPMNPESIATSAERDGQQHGAADPLLRFVEHSYASTFRAERVLTQLEKTMAIVLADAGPVEAPKAKPKTSGDKSKTPSTKGAKGPRKATEVSDPPLLAPQLNDLIDALAQELSGRASDLRTIEDDVERLVGLLTTQRMALDAVSVDSQRRG